MDRLINLFAPRNRLDLVFRSAVLVAAYVYFDTLVGRWATSTYSAQHGLDTLFTVVSATPFAFVVMLVTGRQRKLQQDLAVMAATDLLTGLRNRRAFFADTDAMLRSGQNGFVYLADVDRFKAINDTYGHDAGDKCLIEIAGRLNRVVGQDNIVGRIGGEEFAIFVAGPTDGVSPQALGDALCTAFEVRLGDPLPPLTVSLSAGAVPVRRGQTLADAINIADRALYMAKDAGRARCTIVSEQHTLPPQAA